MSLILELLQYPFMVRALVVGILISICASLLGTSLVLKRYSMIGDSLSHVGFAALAVSYAFYLDPLVISIPVTMGAAFLLLELKESMRIKGDAATALLCSSALAVGVLAISLTRGMNTDVSNYMFGSILAMSSADVWLSLTAGSIIILLYILFYHPLFAEPFLSSDPGAHDGSHDRARHAYDGRAFDLQPDRISCHHGDADLPSVSDHHLDIHTRGTCLLSGGDHPFVCIVHSHRALHCLDKSDRPLCGYRPAKMERKRALRLKG